VWAVGRAISLTEHRANPFEQNARAEKVRKLVEYIDTRAIRAKLDPHRDAAFIADMLETAGPSAWSTYAAGAKTAMPGPESIRQIVEHFRRRAAETAA